jgi:membrane associated rhomboid family serine protease
MGLYDRNYYRDEERGAWLGSRTLVINLILLNAALYVADLLFDHRLSDALGLHSDLFQKPWHVYQLVTYGFFHDPHDLTHILFNMFFLWMFGTDVETVYGRAEFLRIYLVSIVVAGLAWVIFTVLVSQAPAEALQLADSRPPLVGASGGIMALMAIFVLHFPRRIFYIWGILPLPAWALGGLYLLADLLGLADGTDHVAHVAHLGGAAFGAIYFQSGVHLGRMVPRRLSTSMFRLRPKLRIHDPVDDARALNQKVDQILEKISQQGEASLTKQERRTLEEASRRYQRRRQ